VCALYIDRLSFYSLIAVISSEKEYSSFFYFNSAPASERFASLLLRLRLLKCRPQPADFQLSDIRDEKGECQFFNIENDITALCNRITETRLATDPLIRDIGRHFPLEKVLCFCGKTVENEIRETMIFINAARWHASHKLAYKNRPVFYLQKGLWFGYLSEYAASINLDHKGYNAVNSLYTNYYLPKVMDKVVSKIRSIFKRILPVRKAEKAGVRDNRSNTAADSFPMIAHWYSNKLIDFDKKKRIDLIWLLNIDIPHDQILICFDRYRDKETVSSIREFKLKGLVFNIPADDEGILSPWRPTERYSQCLKENIKIITMNWLRNSGRINNFTLFYFFIMGYFIDRYSYWHDFFKTTGIKIKIDQQDMGREHVPMNMALERNKGVSITYQWSNHMHFPVLLSRYTDILFSFGPAYVNIWKETRIQLTNLIYSGYITDYAFNNVKEDAMRLREKLLGNGAEYIICFFDENSSNDRMSVITDNTTASVHKFFLEKLIEDSSLGLILKPGFPNTFYKRLSSVSGLIQKAKATGRCIIIDKGEALKTDMYPSEAAQAADIAVGLLLSGTAALESYLSGARTVFLDLEKLYSNPVYEWGKGKIVFDSMDDIFTAISRYRNDPESMPEFGDLSEWAKDKDPFRDGKASLRIGNYINWLFDAFKEGKGRDEAMAFANSKYAEDWGAENIVKFS